MSADRASEPRRLTADVIRLLLWHFTGDRQLAARLVVRTPNVAAAIALGIRTGRLLDGCSVSWALAKVFEHLQAGGVDTTAFLEAQAHPAPVARDFGVERTFLDAARWFARQRDKDIET